MILYSLRCDNEHEFDSWFKDGAAFDAQAERRLVVCPSCGTDKVEKAIMAPRLARGRAAAPPPPPEKQVASDPRATELRRALLDLRHRVEASCDYVGPRFAEEARRIHYGEAEARGIYGESTREEAEALADEGVEVASLPWIDTGDA
ncbi:MAG: DUF1178 family protein [Tistlia sp.]|uniref:DUF1178 family protein n=1 Tax=Tistlia sp. TaxID=3057121 RepID=UPI0034A1C806